MQNWLGYLKLLPLIVGIYCLNSCGNGSSDQSMPNGTYFGTFSPGVGTATNSDLSCNSNLPESVLFTIASPESVAFTDNTFGSQVYQQTIIVGNFTNPINQNNPCFSGTVSLSQCTNLRSATIELNACNLIQVGNSYHFSAQYIAHNGAAMLQGTINGNM